MLLSCVCVERKHMRSIQNSFHISNHCDPMNYRKFAGYNKWGIGFLSNSTSTYSMIRNMERNLC